MKESRPALIADAATVQTDSLARARKDIAMTSSGMRLRFMVRIAPSPIEIKGLGADDQVTFVPMDAIADGLGGLAATSTKPLGEVSQRGYNYFAEGDILLAKVTPCFENGKKAVGRGLVNGVGFATSEVHVIRPNTRRIGTRFLRYLLCSENFKAEGMMNMTGAGGLRRVSEACILNHRTSLIDPTIQKNISDFLDSETARIDKLIEKKKRLVEVVKEKRSALITAAVTGQTSPEPKDLEDEDSGASERGCGVIPQAGLKTPLHRAHWSTSRLKFLFERKSRPPHEHEEVVTAFRDGVVTLRSNRREDGFTFADKEIGYQGVESGDLVIHSMDAFAGAIGVSNSRGKCSPVYSVAVPRPNAPTDTRFWAYYLRHLAITGFIESLAKGIRERSVDFRWKDVGNLLVNYPDADTQETIADFLDRETAIIDKLVEKTVQSIERQQEFRSALITAAVTGQIDVTTWGRKGQTNQHIDKIEAQSSA